MNEVALTNSFLNWYKKKYQFNYASRMENIHDPGFPDILLQTEEVHLIELKVFSSKEEPFISQVLASLDPNQKGWIIEKSRCFDKCSLAFFWNRNKEYKIVPIESIRLFLCGIDAEKLHMKVDCIDRTDYYIKDIFSEWKPK